MNAIDKRHLTSRTLVDVATGLLSRVCRTSVILLIRAFQGLVRPFLVGTCKFHPTCSQYAVEAVRVHGVIRGGWLAARRLGRCHPFGAGGPDLVPERTRPEELDRPLHE